MRVVKISMLNKCEKLADSNSVVSNAILLFKSQILTESNVAACIQTGAKLYTPC